MSDHPNIENLPLEVDGVAVRETVREIFRNSENGTPDNITKAGCLALAPEGKTVWNAWRSEFPVKERLANFSNVADFQNVNFVEESIDFSEFMFGDGACFQGARWGDGAKFRDAQWGSKANLQSVQFANRANFQGAHWGDFARFDGARWGQKANFRAARWGRFAVFSGACWDSNADFIGAQWDIWANFSEVQWGDEADFRGAQWAFGSQFQDARWGHSANLKGSQWGDGANFKGSRWRNGVNFQGAHWESLRPYWDTEQQWKSAKEWAEERGLSPNSFGSLDFSGSKFDGEVSFSNRNFIDKTHFGLFHSDYVRRKMQQGKESRSVLLEETTDTSRNCIFGSAPIFHGCEFHQDTSFEGAQFPPASGSEKAARAYRTLKLAFNKQQAIREEQLFFRLEMDEEKVGHRIKGLMALKRKQAVVVIRAYGTWLLYWLYRQVSDYGLSVVRPLLMLFILVLLFAQISGTYTHVESCFDIWKDTCNIQGDWLKYSLQQALPLPGFDKIEPTIKDVSLFWLVFHKTLSLAALFLIGLALRNLFKLK